MHASVKAKVENIQIQGLLALGKDVAECNFDVEQMIEEHRKEFGEDSTKEFIEGLRLAGPLTKYQNPASLWKLPHIVNNVVDVWNEHLEDKIECPSIVTAWMNSISAKVYKPKGHRGVILFDDAAVGFTRTVARIICGSFNFSGADQDVELC